MDKDRCLHLCDELEKRQFVTWIDLRHQGDFLYEKLALAVQKITLMSQINPCNKLPLLQFVT